MERSSASAQGPTAYSTANHSTADDATAEMPAPPRQRWRLILVRSPDAPALAGRELNDAWEVALVAAGLPLHRPAGRARARIAFGAPIPATLAAERELADIVLTESLPAWRVREALANHILEGWRLVDVQDVWLGAPALAGQVAAADYRIDLGDANADLVGTAAEAILAAKELSRERPRGGSMVRYDLRPLLAGVTTADPGPPLQIRVRTRFDPVLGTGRPEEVVAALAEAAGLPLEIRATVRERLILAEDLD